MSVSLHTASVFFPRTRCVSFSVFRSGSLRRTLLSLSLFLRPPPPLTLSARSLAPRIYVRAGGRTDGATLPNTRLCWCESDCLLPLSRSQTRRGWSRSARRRHALVKFRWLRRASSRAAHRISRSHSTETRNNLLPLRERAPFSLSPSFASPHSETPLFLTPVRVR